jgi:hypothetical protein
MSNLYRGPSIDASYQVSVHLVKRFRRRRLKCEKLTDDKCKSSHCLWQGQLKMLIRKLFTRQMIINIMWMMRCIQGGECTSWKTSCAAWRQIFTYSISYCKDNIKCDSASNVPNFLLNNGVSTTFSQQVEITLSMCLRA